MLRLKSLQERVSLLFYHHGLLCASHPFAIISLVITIVMFMCYPLINLPLPGNAPQQFITPVEGYTIPPPMPPLDSIADSKQPRWYFGEPVAYIQQIVVRAAVLPWNSERLVPSDAYRASLSTVFELLEHIDNYQQHNGTEVRSLSDLCLRVAEVTADKKSLPSNGLLPLLPEYNCLQLSPARFWYQDKQKFMSDPEIINTVLKSQDSLLLSIKDLLLGVSSKIAGIKKYYVRNRQCILTYAVTIVFRKHQHSFVSGLRDHLLSVYPLSSTVNGTRSVAHLVHVHYRNHNYIVEYTPLMLAYVVLCLYLYFSVRKIEMVKSKWGLALSAMITVFASLLMSMSLCVFFGLTPSLSGSEIFPYLVVVIGLENILVVTKSVVSTPVHLDVKLRIALGLQNEGWYMFRHLVTELFVLAVGFFTFVPAIQEFCLFAVLGLGSDFFLQMFFFTTVLSIDIRRMELSDLQSRGIQEAMRRDSLEQRSAAVPPLSGQCPVVGRLYSQPQQPYANAGTHACPLRPGSTIPVAGTVGPTRPPNVHRLVPAELNDDVYCVDVDDERPPPLMRLLKEWAQYRVFQRGIMVCVIIWILLIVYKTGLIEDIEVPPQTFTPGPPSIPHATHGQPGADVWPTAGDTKDLLLDATGPEMDSVPGSVGGGASPGPSVTHNEPRSGVGGVLVHDNLELWKSLSPNHWKQLFSYYNMSLLGRYITILPSIHLSISVSPEAAVEMRHPEEVAAMSSIVQPPNLWGRDDEQATAGDGELSADGGRSSAGGANISNLSSPLDIVMQRLIRYPRTKLEFVLTILLGIASLILLLYTLLEMYKCICSRNYAKWRASWQRQRRDRRYRRGVGSAGVYYTEFREAVPLVLNGHRQEVECIVCDGQLIVSSCLGGEIRVWDSVSGDCLQTINRSPNLLAKQRSSSPRERFDSDRISDGARTPPLSADPLAISSPFLAMTPRSAPSPVFLTDSLASSMDSIDVVAVARGKTPRNSVGEDRRKVSASSVGHSRHRSIDFALSQIVPNLAETIDTDFLNAARTKNPPFMMHDADTKSPPREIPGSSPPDLPAAVVAAATPPRNGYDFTHFQSYFDEHRRLQEEQQLHQIRRRAMATGAAAMTLSAEEKTGCGAGTTLAGSAENIAARIAHTEHRQGRSISIGESSPTVNSAGDGWQLIGAAIWCLACKDNLIVAGCRNGSVEKLYTVCELARLLVLGIRAPKSCTVSYYPSDIVLPTLLFTDYQSHRKIRSIVLPDELLQHTTKKSVRKRSRSGRLVDSTVSTTNVENVSPENRSGVRKSASLHGKVQPAVLDFDELENENIIVNDTTPGSNDIGKRHRNKSAAETLHVEKTTRNGSNTRDIGLHKRSGSTTRSRFRPRLDRAARSLDFSEMEMTEDLNVSGLKSGKVATKKIGGKVVDVTGGNVTDEIGDGSGRKSRKPTSAAAAVESEKIVGKVRRTSGDVLESDQDKEIGWKNVQKRNLEVLESEMSTGDAVVPSVANAGERWKTGKRRSEHDRPDVDYTPNATSPGARTQPENGIVWSPDDPGGFIPDGYNGGNAVDQVEEDSDDSGERLMVSGGLTSSTEDLSEHRRADSDAPCMDRNSNDLSDPRCRDVLTGRTQSSERKESPSTWKIEAKKSNRSVTLTTATSTPRRPTNRQMTTTITEKTPQNRLAATFDASTILSGTTGSAQSVKFNFGTSPFSDNFDIMSLASSCGFLDLLSTPAITSNDCLFLPVVKSHSSPHDNGVTFVAMPTRRRQVVPIVTTALNDVSLRDRRPAVVECTDRELVCGQVENSDAGFPGCPIPDRNSENHLSMKKFSRTELRQQKQKLKELEDSPAVERTPGKTGEQQLKGSRLVAVESMRADHGKCKTSEKLNGKPSRKRLCQKSCQIPVTTRAQTVCEILPDSEKNLSKEVDTTLKSLSMRTTKGQGGKDGPDMEMVDIHQSARNKLPEAGGGKSKAPPLVDRGPRVAEQSCKPPSRGMKAGLKCLEVKQSNKIPLHSGKSVVLDINDVVMATKDSSMLTAHVEPDINIDDGNSHDLLSSDYNKNSDRESSVSGKPLSTPAAPVSMSVVDMSVSEDLSSPEAGQQMAMGEVRCSRVPSRSSVASVSSNSLFETSTEKRKRFTVQNSNERLYASDRASPMEVRSMDQDVDVTTTASQEYHSRALTLNSAAEANEAHPGNSRSMDRDVENRSRCSMVIGAISITSSSSDLETGAGPTASQLITIGRLSTRKADLIPEKLEESEMGESDTRFHREANPSHSQVPQSQPVDSTHEQAVDRSARETIFPATAQLGVDRVGSMPTDSSGSGTNGKLESRVKSSFATWTDVCGISEGNLSASESPASDTLPYTSMYRKQMEMGGRWKSNVEPRPTSTIEAERPENGKSSVAIQSNCPGSALLTAAPAPDSNRFYGNRLPLHGHKGLPMDSKRCRQKSSVSLPMSTGAQQRHSTNSAVETSGNDTKGGSSLLELSASAQRASIQTISAQTSQSVQGKSSEPDIRLFIGSDGDFPRAAPGFPETQDCVPGNSQVNQVRQSEHPGSQTGKVKSSSAIPCIFSTGSFRESPAVIRQPRENPTIMSVPGNETSTRPNEMRPSVRQQKSSFVTDLNHNRVFAGNDSESRIDSSSREPNENYISSSRNFRSSAQLGADHIASQSLSQTLRGKASEPVTFIWAGNPVPATTKNFTISSGHPALTGFAEDIRRRPELPSQSGTSIGSHTSPGFPDSGEASDDSGLAVVCSQDSVQSTGGKGWKSSVAIHYADM